MDPTIPVSTEPSGIDHALPGWAVDTIRRGLRTSRNELSADNKAIYGQCIRIAMSAQIRGWTEAEYKTAIRDRGGKGLWAQIATKKNGDPAPDTTRYKTLTKAWSQARANLTDTATRTRDELAADATEIAYQWADRLDAGTDNLSANDRAVMEYVIGETVRRGMTRVTCPGRDVAEQAGIAHQTAVNALKRLTERGLLVKVHAGVPGAAGSSSRRAAIYALAVDQYIDMSPGNDPYVLTTPERADETATDTSPEPTESVHREMRPVVVAETPAAHRKVSVHTTWVDWNLAALTLTPLHDEVRYFRRSLAAA